MRILIADDEAWSREELRLLVGDLAPLAEIREVKDGRELLEVIYEEPFDLVLLDIRMPGMNGLDSLASLTAAFRDSMEWVIVSGHSEFEYARRAMTLGAADYLLKPVDRKELQQVVESCRLKIVQSRHVEAGTSGSARIRRLVESAKKIVDDHFTEAIGVTYVAERLNVTPNYLSARFKELENESFTAYITGLRMEKALVELKKAGRSIKDVSLSLGYGSSRHFARLFREKYGITPSDYMNTVENDSSL